MSEGAAPIVRGEVVEKPETIASAIRIGNPAGWQGALAAARESGGEIGMVSDEEIQNAYSLLARWEGVFCELASAAAVAGLLKHSRTRKGRKGDTVVCVLTGHGLKDPDAALRVASRPHSVRPETAAVLTAMGL